jgi:hypothetical protein
MARLLYLALIAVLTVHIVALDAIAGADNVSTAVFASTLMIHTRNGQATGFTIDVDGRQYLITARHVVAGMEPEGTVEIATFNNANKLVYKSLTMKIFSCAGSIDIAVLVPPIRLTAGDTMEPQLEMTFGADAYFTGFPAGEYPFGTYSSAKANAEASAPVPLVKKGMISGVQYQVDGDGELILLDGYNVVGFSGSPITYWQLPTATDQKFHSYVIGVVSGFTPDFGPVLVPKEVRSQDVKAEDKIVTMPDHPGHVYKLEPKEIDGKKTYETVMLNTGIVRSYGIKPAIDLIKLHPIGPSVSQP